MPGVWFTVPVRTLILPHYAFEAQKFLPCLFSLDILVRMCACLALKNLTELRTQCRCIFLALGHKKTLPGSKDCGYGFPTNLG